MTSDHVDQTACAVTGGPSVGVTMIEHKLAHISQRQGNNARYVGIRKNTFDLRRASAIQNLETLHLAEAPSRKAA
jgi:hypothetical protein